MNNRFFFMISRLNHIIKLQFRKAYNQSGINITNSQMGLLFALEKGNPLTMSSLSEILRTDNGATFRLVDNLVKSGYVKREQNPDDLRQQLVTITDTGKEITTAALKFVRKSNQKLRELFSEEELEVFNRVLARLVTELEKEDFFLK